VGRKISRNQLLGRLLSELLPLLTQFEREGFTHFRKAWSGFDIAIGRQVVLHLGERTVLGLAAGVSETGAFLLDTPQGQQSFHGGEVSLRLQN
jgi:BirA family biotin operon repressor/biotin-[acetyl-CoA-carboxylase] ligase